MRSIHCLWSYGVRTKRAMVRSLYALIPTVRLTEYRPASSQILSVMVAMAWILSATPCWSQATTGSIVGTVTDSTQAVVPNAQVTATNVSTGVISAAPKDRFVWRVWFSISASIGTYTLTIAQPGFETSKSCRESHSGSTQQITENRSDLR